MARHTRRCGREGRRGADEVREFREDRPINFISRAFEDALNPLAPRIGERLWVGIGAWKLMQATKPFTRLLPRIEVAFGGVPVQILEVQPAVLSRNIEYGGASANVGCPLYERVPLPFETRRVVVGLFNPQVRAVFTKAGLAVEALMECSTRRRGSEGGRRWRV